MPTELMANNFMHLIHWLNSPVNSQKYADLLSILIFWNLRIVFKVAEKKPTHFSWYFFDSVFS